MRQNSKKIVFRFLAFLLVTLTIFTSLPINTEAAVKDSFKISDGASYKDIRSSGNAVRVMEININDPFTDVEIGYPSVLNKLQRTTTQALQHHQDGHKVIGAINGSFFQFRKPMHLVSESGRLVHAGEVSNGNASYVNEPIAFGVNENGKGIIDHYQLGLQYTHNGKGYSITSTNKQRTPDSVMLYTSDFPSDYTDTNEYGKEVIVSLSSHPTLKFGSTYKGKIVGIRDYGNTEKTKIPKNGFVLSAHGNGLEKLADMEEGDSLSLSVDIDDKWEDSSFMLASGPMLVENGKVSLSMDPNSFRARQVAPRTAVAVDKSGGKVFFVTVDGRQKGYSVGMNMTDFAKYLVSLGADRALNLDGGGSTTMAVRYPGKDKVSLANSPSDGSERAVSTMLMAVSTAPEPIYTDVRSGDSHFDGIQWLTEKGIKGYEDGSFGVDKELTRPHTAIMFTRALDLRIPNPDKAENYFNDVKANDQYASFIAAVGEAGVFKGSGGKFMPNKTLTREQMASTLVNALDLKSDGKNVDVNLDNVSNTHKVSVQILADLGITNQLDNFRPKEPVTRGQFATFLYLGTDLR
ncbi:phosphodiester glycosidase family protein [Lentibacillus sp. Marseille-P4043]|uniref:phosphodiester glycosidase family protein n=1 Tax=Lentibacillus sp. Marseille-P4043 TaxID=2040293 RepID=UPI000D0B2D6D|nr:phosphodiester glycosidase family protein [Lentibacillus sp. Marseille-P4043]